MSLGTREEAWFEKTKAGKVGMFGSKDWKRRFFVIDLEAKVISYYTDAAKTDKKGRS